MLDREEREDDRLWRDGSCDSNVEVGEVKEEATEQADEERAENMLSTEDWTLFIEDMEELDAWCII